MHKYGLANANVISLADGKRGIWIEREETRQVAVSLRASDGILWSLPDADLPVIGAVRAEQRTGSAALRLHLAHHS